MDQDKCTPPAERVQFILGEDDVDGTHESHPLFSELEELCGEGAEQQWRETARFVLILQFKKKTTNNIFVIYVFLLQVD